MIEQENFNPASHIKAIDESIKELRFFHDRTSDPAPNPHQYIGTVIDNTVGLLTAPANSLDQGDRYIKFEKSSNWISLMQAVHRSFFSSVHFAVEKGLSDICEKSNLIVNSSIGKDDLMELEKISQRTTDKEIQTCVDKLTKSIKRLSRKPNFDDYLNSVLQASNLTKKTKSTWRNFFKALSTVRNKVSHSDSTLDDSEKQKLVEGRLEFMVSPSGQLSVNTRMYVQIVNRILDFFDEITVAFPPF